MHVVQKVILSHLETHYRSCLNAIDDLKRNPFNTLITLLVISITLSLPASLVMLVQNGQQFISGWDPRSQISLYLDEEASFHETNELAKALKGQASIMDVEILGPEKALKEFQAQTGIQNILGALGKNPLPYSLILYLAPELPIAKAEYLVNQLQIIPKVDSVQLDLLWLKRLEAMMQFGETFISIMTVILSLAVLLVIGNTTRINLQNKKTTIEITQLFGASKAFILRPFLYMGFWYGLIGALLALVILMLGVLSLNPSVKTLANLYQSDFYFLPLNFSNSLTLITIAVLLCITGTWVTGHRFLSHHDY